MTSGRRHHRGLAPWQHSSKETSQRWRAVGDTVTDLTGPVIELKILAPLAMSFLLFPLFFKPFESWQRYQPHSLTLSRLGTGLLWRVRFGAEVDRLLLVYRVAAESKIASYFATSSKLFQFQFDNPKISSVITHFCLFSSFF